MTKRIPVAEPLLNGNEKAYVTDCVETAWISGSGKYVRGFEEGFAEFCGTKHAIAVANGTVALHVALVALGLEPGDEVIVPDLTYIASANTVQYCGATPVFVDCDPVTWTIDPEDVRRKITPRTRGIMPVHIYGHPAEMGPINEIAKEHDLFVIEDAAEAHGALYKDQRTGGISDVATFSFYGNKIITTGEGGMITTNDDELAKKIRLLRGQGMDPDRRYWFPVVGYNYRMTNIQAALWLAQFERIDWFIQRRREVAAAYEARLKDSDLTLPAEASWATNVYWLYSVLVPEDVDRDQVMADMDDAGIETRPFFYPMHTLPPYHDPDGDAKFPVSTDVAARGMNLPSSATLTDDDLDYVSETLLACIAKQRS